MHGLLKLSQAATQDTPGVPPVGVKMNEGVPSQSSVCKGTWDREL